MPNISLIQKNGEYKYPATITEAVVDLNKQKKLSTLLDELSDKDFKGKVNQSTDISGLHDYKQGWHWIVNTAGRYVGLDCEVGDMIYCIQNFNALYLISDFEVLQSNVTYITNELIDELLLGHNPGGAIPYYKPEGGIPESDLTSELLNKIDSINSLATVAATGDYNDLDNTPNLNLKADKDSDAVEGNIAIFNSEGNPVDSGKTFPFTYEDLYLTFEALEDTIFKFRDYTNEIQYSTDNGVTWSELAKLVNVAVSTGSKILWKGNMTPSGTQGIGRFRSEDSNSNRKKFNVEGNIMSLLYGDNFKGLSDISNKAYVFYDLFDYSYVVDASNLILPNTVSDHAYFYTFRQCSELVKAPKLPAIVLAPYCYDCMFDSCTKLKEIPELPATALAEGCYIGMFTNCTQLNGYVHLPAETLVNYCYLEMFSLVGRPIIKLDATNIIQGTFLNWSSTAIVIKKDNYEGISGNNVYTESEWEVVRHYELSGYYTKPNGGIPKNDLSSGVQTSLGKADSALQSFTESDPTVPSWAKQSSKPTYTAQEVGALPSSTTIPTKTSDLTNDSGFLTQHQSIKTIGGNTITGSGNIPWPTYTANDTGALPNTTTLADLEDATHKTVTPTEKATWNGKQDALTGYAEETFVFTLADDSTVTKTLLVK